MNITDITDITDITCLFPPMVQVTLPRPGMTAVTGEQPKLKPSQQVMWDVQKSQATAVAMNPEFSGETKALQGICLQQVSTNLLWKDMLCMKTSLNLLTLSLICRMNSMNIDSNTSKWLQAQDRPWN